MISKRILLARTLARLGPRALRLAGQHRLRLRSGFYEKKFPVADWRTEDIRFLSPFVIPPTFQGQPQEGVAYFSWDRRPLPENWHTHPLTGHIYPTRHWSRIPMFAGGDIKWMWEPSRMDWVVEACRAGLPDPAKLLGQIKAWRDQNRPNEGVNWACGQETSFRMFALMLAATQMELRDRKAAAEIRAMLPQHAERVESAFSYAVSQHNNHGLSETVALFLAGHALPDHKRASIWRQEGKSWFCRQVDEQFTEDGWYAQHSHNYTRVALVDGLIGLRTGILFNDPLPSGTVHKLAAAARLLASASVNGRVPNYGSNDGANVLPLHGGDYSDFRPVIAAVLRAAGEGSPFPAGPWDEMSLWFGLPLTYGDPEPIRSAPQGGYYALEKSDWRAIMRCHTYVDRPMHADMLHVDVWHGAENLIRDGGTFSYNDPDGIGDFLKSTAAHNAITVDGRDQMVKGTRFLWLDWTESKLMAKSPDSMTGEHYGYRSREGLVHRRKVSLLENGVTIEDTLMAVAAHRYAMNLRLGGEGWVQDESEIANERYRIQIQAPAGAKIRLINPSDTSAPLNLESTHYGQQNRTYAIALEFNGESSKVTTTVRTR